MEPVFMVLGQSAATAACLAIDDKVDVQEVDYAKLQEAAARRTSRCWSSPRPPSPGAIDPKKLAGVVVDDAEAELKGFEHGQHERRAVRRRRLPARRQQGHGKQSAKFSPDLPAAGKYEVRLAYTANPNRATNVPVTRRARRRRRRW